MVIKEGYKQTEIGVIPMDWEVKNLLDNFTIKARIGWQGLTTAEYLKTGDYGLVTGTDFKNGYIDWDNCVYVEKERFIQDKNIQLKIYDVLVTKDGTIGKVAFVDKVPNPTTLNSGVFVLRPKNENIDNRFFYYLLMSFYFDSFLSKITAGSTITHLYQKDFVNFNFIHPTKAEQIAIANALSDADGLITGLEKLIAKKRNIKQGAMQQLLQPKEGWEVKSIKDIVITPVTDGPHETPSFIENGVPFLSVNNIVDNKINWTDLRYISKEDDAKFSLKCKPIKNDILLGKAASVGKIAVVESDIDFNIWSPLALIRLKDHYSVKYIFYCFQTEDILKQISFFTNSSSQGNIGMGDIEKFQFNIPSTLEGQTRIATILSDIDAELSALEQKLEKYKKIKLGMMQELLTGKTRLV